MADTMTIDFDSGEAIDEFGALEVAIAETNEATTELAKTGETVAKAQEQQIRVIHEQTTSYGAMTVAFADVSAAGLRFATALVPIYERSMQIITSQRSIDFALKVVETQLEKQAAKWAAVQTLGESAGTSLANVMARGGTAVAGVTAGFVAWEAVMARTGKRADDLGNVTTNLDRIKAAAAGARGDVAEVLSLASERAKQFANYLNPIPPIWKEIDASATRSADQMIVNINQVRDFAFGFRKAEEQAAALEARIAKTGDGYARLGAITEKWGSSLDEFHNKSKAADEYIKKITEVETFVNSKFEVEESKSASALQRSITRIDQEIARRQEAARVQIENGKFTEQEEAKFDAEVGRLTEARWARQQQIDQGARDAQSLNQRLFLESEKQKTEMIRAAYDERAKKDEEYLQSLRDKKKAEAEWEGNQEKEAAHAAEVFRQQAAEDRQKKIDADQKSQQEAAQKSIQMELQKQEAMRAARDAGLQKAGFNGQDVLRQQNPREVLKNLQDQARQKAADDVKNKFSGAINGTPNADALKGTLGGDDPTRIYMANKADAAAQAAARRQAEIARRKAEQEAVRQSTRDFVQGKTDPEQLAQAQVDAANKTAQSLVASGKISQDVAQALANQLQIAAKTQVQADQTAAQVKQILEAQQALQNAQNPRRAGMGGQGG